MDIGAQVEVGTPLRSSNSRAVHNGAGASPPLAQEQAHLHEAVT
jgi:hypothetical protein